QNHSLETLQERPRLFVQLEPLCRLNSSIDWVHVSEPGPCSTETIAPAPLCAEHGAHLPSQTSADQRGRIRTLRRTPTVASSSRRISKACRARGSHDGTFGSNGNIRLRDSVMSA